MKVAVTADDRLKAARTTSPTPKQAIRRQVFDAVATPVISGEIDRDELSNDFDWGGEANLQAVVMESDGRVWVRISFASTTDVPLSELRLPREEEERVVTLLKKLREPGKSTRRTKGAKRAAH